MSELCRRIFLEGSAGERGVQHGKQLKSEIETTVEIYARLFGRPDAEIARAARRFARRVSEFDPDLTDELEGIAEGCGVAPHWIHAINARSEMFGLALPECTALHFSRTGILGQNWDYIDEFEDLFILLSITMPDGLRILTLSEPGMLGKIGLNSAGLGVCLNLLIPTCRLDGLPIHVLLRTLLECHTLEQARERIAKTDAGRSGNILIGSKGGEAIDVEFDGRTLHRPDTGGSFFAHTNHYLMCGNDRNPLYEDSCARLGKASERADTLENQSVEEMAQILGDQSHEEHPICTPYRPVLGNNVGTVCSVVMELSKGVLHLRKGPNPDGRLEAIAV
ncbi:MAG: peptidase C45 [bacterium]|nr:peptidase C45 [bacterium]